MGISLAKKGIEGRLNIAPLLQYRIAQCENCDLQEKCKRNPNLERNCILSKISIIMDVPFFGMK